MTGPGEFSTHTRDGDYVTKQINRRHPAGERLVTAATCSGVQGMVVYLRSLQAAQVRLPPDLSIVAAEPLSVRHRWVQGPNLTTTARSDLASFASAVAEIGRWVRTLDRTDARVDTNLANFCLVEGRPVLVDVLPPLIPSLRPKPENLFDELFSALCFDTSITLDALIGYALRTTLRATNPVGAQDLLPIARELTMDTDGDSFPARWFAARRRLAMRAAEGTVSPDRVHDFFALTSILGFRQLNEAARELRLEQVAQHIRELSV